MTRSEDPHRSERDDVELDADSVAWEIEEGTGQTLVTKSPRPSLWALVTPLVWVALGVGVIVGGSLGFALGFYGGLRSQLGDVTTVEMSEDAVGEEPAADATDEMATEPAAEEPAEAAPKPVVAPKPKPRPSRPVARPTRAPAPEPKPAVAAPITPAPAPTASSTLTVRAKGASAAKAGILADVYIDGSKVGRAPLEFLPVQPGRHRIRIDCIFEGRTHRGDDTFLDVPPDTDAMVEHKCDMLVYLGVPN